VVAHGFKDFATAIRHKLVLEISSIDPEKYRADKAVVIKAAARPLYAQVLPAPPGTSGQAPTILRPPAQREQNCDRFTPGGFGGFGFPGFDRRRNGP
jgi:hypothetical protein